MKVMIKAIVKIIHEDEGVGEGTDKDKREDEFEGKDDDE